MPLTSSVSVRQLSDGSGIGTVLGVSRADPISFYGLTPVAQQSVVSSLINVIATSVASPVSTQTASSAGFGFSTAAMFNSTMTMLGQVASDLTQVQGLVNLLAIACTTVGFIR